MSDGLTDALRQMCNAQFKSTATKDLVLKIKKYRDEAMIPTRATDGSAGFDLYACDDISIRSDHKQFEYFTGICVEIPQGYVGLIFPRSSITQQNLRLANSVGVIDSDYRGEIKLRFDVIGDVKYDKNGRLDFTKYYNIGNRIGQLIVVPVTNLDLEVVETLSSTSRGNGGFGSSGE